VSIDVGPLQDALGRKLVRAFDKTREAEDRLAAGRPQGAKRSLAAAARAMSVFRSRLNSRKARRLVEPTTRALLVQQGTSILDDLRALAGTL